VGPDARPAETPPTVGGIGTGAVVATAAESVLQFSLVLSHGQVQDLVQQEAASRKGGGGLLGVILALNGVGEPVKLEDLERDPGFRSPRISHTTIRSLLVLSAFGSGAVHGVNSLAEDLGIGASTVWRYLRTWVAIGVLEEREDRRYQLARQWRIYMPKTARRGSAAKARKSGR
jgi:hypothetical protein